MKNKLEFIIKGTEMNAALHRITFHWEQFAEGPRRLQAKP